MRFVKACRVGGRRRPHSQILDVFFILFQAAQAFQARLKGQGEEGHRGNDFHRPDVRQRSISSPISMLEVAAWPLQNRLVLQSPPISSCSQRYMPVAIGATLVARG